MGRGGLKVQRLGVGMHAGGRDCCGGLILLTITLWVVHRQLTT